MKSNKISWTGIFLLFLVLCAGSLAFYGMITMQKSFDAYEEFACNSAKIEVTLGILKDIERIQEHQQLCNDNECTVFMENRIKEKTEAIDQISEYKCGEKG